jgi:iron complex transport system permease protein
MIWRKKLIPDTLDTHTPPLELTSSYRKFIRKKWLLLFGLLGLMALISAFAIFFGSYQISILDGVRVLLGKTEGPASVVISRIRLPRVTAAIVSGWGISLSGLCIQSLLKNPLGSPSTLGISQGAAFGAALSVIVFGAHLLPVSLFAFSGAVLGTVVILILASLRRLSPEAVILSGVALASLFGAAMIVIQYLATEIELAMAVFWTFGDVARSNWEEIAILTGMTLLFSILVVLRRWDLNALASGDDIAKSLGVNVKRLRTSGMLAAALVAAMATAFHGVIAFVGLVAPHMARRITGNDHRLLIPYSAVIGALLLLSADTLGRILIGSGSLPVGVTTSFLGAPIFIYLLLREYQ